MQLSHVNSSTTSPCAACTAGRLCNAVNAVNAVNALNAIAKRCAHRRRRDARILAIKLHVWDGNSASV